MGLTTCYDLDDCSGTPGEEGYECTKAEPRGLDCEGYRLPTEAEWERAVRAGSGSALYTGDITIADVCNSPELDVIAWYCGNSGGTTHPVGRRFAVVYM